jgi:periplasmic divalent cation tolerance protein
MTDIFTVTTAAETEAAAKNIARSAVEGRFAASAQVIGPVTSAFWHLGEFGMGTEWRVILATTRERYPDLEAHLVKVHPWDNPEITATELVTASARYCEWVRQAMAG